MVPLFFWIKALVAGGVLCWGAYTDYKNRIIPNAVPVTLLLLGLLDRQPFTLSKLLGLLVVPLLMLLLQKHAGFRSGMGDIKLYGALGFFEGLPLLTLDLGLLVLLSLAAGLLKKHAFHWKQTIPVCTYLAPAYGILMAFLWLQGA